MFDIQIVRLSNRVDLYHSSSSPSSEIKTSGYEIPVCTPCIGYHDFYQMKCNALFCKVTFTLFILVLPNDINNRAAETLLKKSNCVTVQHWIYYNICVQGVENIFSYSN